MLHVSKTGKYLIVAGTRDEWKRWFLACVRSGNTGFTPATLRSKPLIDGDGAKDLIDMEQDAWA